MNEMAQKEGAVTGITVEVEELQRKNRDSFRIPEWFLYTSRAFLTLEGVSLQADENFSIVKSCFPYVAKRLVGDDSPRVQKYVQSQFVIMTLRRSPPLTDLVLPSKTLRFQCTA